MAVGRALLLGALLGVCGVSGIPLPEEGTAALREGQDDLSLDAGSGPAPPPSLRALYEEIVQSFDDIVKEAEQVESALNHTSNRTVSHASHQVGGTIGQLERAAESTANEVEGLLGRLLNSTSGQTQALVQRLEREASGAVNDIGRLLNDLANGSDQEVQNLLHQLEHEPGLAALEHYVSQLVNNTFGDIGTILRRFNTTSLIPPPPQLTIQP